jgi:hypothetical protein
MSTANVLLAQKSVREVRELTNPEAHAHRVVIWSSGYLGVENSTPNNKSATM